MTLEYYREASELTKKQFADKLGISTQFLHSLLDGKGNPSLDTLEEMATKLNLEFSPLFRAPTTSSPVAKRKYRTAETPAEPPQRASNSRSRTPAKRQPPAPE